MNQTNSASREPGEIFSFMTTKRKPKVRYDSHLIPLEMVEVLRGMFFFLSSTSHSFIVILE